jgi:hypothetical protein
MCSALISPAKRARAAASAAAPSASKITIAGVLAASCAVNAIPAGVAPSRASSQKSPTFGGSSGSSGVTGTYAGPAASPSSKPGWEVPGLFHDSFGPPAGGSVFDIALHLATSIRDEAERRTVRGTESLFGHYRPKAPQASDAVWLASLATDRAAGPPTSSRSLTRGMSAPFSPALRRDPDGVIAGSGFIHSLLTASSGTFA